MKLREYQKPMYKGALSAMQDGILRSSYYASTGAGKTVIFAKLIQELFKSKERKVVLVCHPRLSLSTDQQDRFVEMFNVPFTSFHSGTVVQSMENEGDSDFPRNRSVQSRAVLEQILEDTSDYDHIIFTSYQSLHKIAHLDFDLVVCDEAHNLLEKRTAKVLDKIKSQTMFFTATPIITEMGLSMDDVEKFGVNDPEANINPSDLIRQGYNVLPQVFYAEITTDQSGEVEDYVETVGQVFSDQLQHIDDSVPHKMLVALPNTKRFKQINEGIDRIREIVGFDVDVYTIAAGINTKNGSSRGLKSRAKTLRLFAESPVPSIVIHCDTLSEGIDIDGLTGAFIARGLGHAKFIQTIGRCIRPLKCDLKANGKPKAMRFRKKKYAPIHVAVVDGEVRGGMVKVWYDALLAAGYGAMVEGVLTASEILDGDSEEGDQGEMGQHSNVLDVSFNKLKSEIANDIFGDLVA